MMIKAVIFDKDGTLFDFRKSWGGWVNDLLADLGGDTAHLARVLGFDPVRLDFAPDSLVIAGTTPQVGELLLPHLGGMSREALNDLMHRKSMNVPMAPAVNLPLVLGDLRQKGIRIGLATNDTEGPARQHLADAGVLDLFDFVAGCDSGWGGKPEPGQLLAFAAQLGLPPANIAMVGDSLHDLHAAKSAGMSRVAVLTGIAKRADLVQHADVVLTDIGELADWIAARRSI